jgi:drug/metabolite transporter (DMT)-like permease
MVPGGLLGSPAMGALVGILAGLGAACSFGSGDFAGGLASRRAGGLRVAAAVQVVGLLALLVVLLVVRPPLPAPGPLLVGIAAGIAGGIGLAALYAGLAIGAMGLVAALSSLGSVTVPVLVGALTGVILVPLQLAGIALAGVAAVAAGGASREGVSRTALVLAGVAAVAFGSWYVLLDVAARAADPVWGLVASRASSALLIGAAAVVRTGSARVGGVSLLVVLAGALDVGGNVLFVVARSEIAVGLAAALAGLYPLVTMLLARVLLGEALPRLGVVAVGLAIGAVVLISLGSLAA